MKGHFSKMCINPTIVSATTEFTPTLAAISDIASHNSLSAACMDILVNGKGVSVLIDTGSTLSFYQQCICKRKASKS